MLIAGRESSPVLVTVTVLPKCHTAWTGQYLTSMFMVMVIIMVIMTIMVIIMDMVSLLVTVTVLPKCHTAWTGQSLILKKMMKKYKKVWQV